MSAEMQEYIANKVADKSQAWIYKLIRGESGSEKECVYIDDPEFLLCRDLHPGSDDRFLVIFKDLSLRTIRDLRQEHIPLLTRVRETVVSFLGETQDEARVGDYRIFFHYTPSVFQLHAHVSVMNSYTQSFRVHPLSLVVRNLSERSTYYRDALILISLCRSMKQLSVYSGLFACGVLVADGTRSRVAHGV